MRIFLGIILAVTFFSGRSLAQEENNVATATSALQDVLSVLKQSVEKLSVDNDQLSARDNAMKQQVLQLQLQLGQLQAQGNILNNTAEKLQDNTPRYSQQITKLEEKNDDVDDHIQKVQSDIKLAQQSLEAGYQEDQKLLLQLKGIQNVLSAPPKVPPESQAEAGFQKEKLKLMKMIYDSQQRQEALHESILEFQKNAPLVPAAGALAHQQLLKGQIKDLEDQMAAFPPDKTLASAGGQWDDTQLHQLEAELKVLEKNYLQLKDLMAQMSKKAQGTRMTVSQRTEEDKLQGSIDDLNRQGKSLRADLNDLRSQLVDLDKRKSHLEVMVKHLPTY